MGGALDCKENKAVAVQWGDTVQKRLEGKVRMEADKPVLTNSAGTWRPTDPDLRIFAEHKWSDTHLWGEIVG